MKWRKKYTEPQDLYLFTVWVGGGEWNSHYLTEQQAVALVADLTEQGYEDIAIEKVFNG